MGLGEDRAPQSFTGKVCRHRPMWGAHLELGRLRAQGAVGRPPPLNHTVSRAPPLPRRCKGGGVLQPRSEGPQDPRAPPALSPSCTCCRPRWRLRPWALRARPEKGLHGWGLQDE